MAGKRKYNPSMSQSRTQRGLKKGKYSYTTSRPRYNYVQLVKPETKYFDTGINTAVTFAGTDWSSSEVPCDNYINASGAAAAYTDSCLIPTAQGSGYGNVDGNKYKLKHIRVKGDLTHAVLQDQADMSSSVMVRVLLVRDKQPNGAQAQGEDVLQDYGTVGENLYSFMRVANNVGRFEILKDKIITLDAAVAGTDAANTNSIAFTVRKFKLNHTFKKPLDVSIKSGNATPTIAGTINENIFMLVGAVRAAAATAITVQACTRAYYCD